MGCGKPNGSQSKIEEKKQGFQISIIHPQTKRVHDFKVYDEKQKSGRLLDIMNGLCFSDKVSEKCDGNFISIYDAVEDRFQYFVQKLDGYEIENVQEPLKGRIWVPYINEKKCDWDEIVEHNTRITINDQVVWKLEQHRKNR